MNIDIPHIIVSVLIIYVVVLLVERTDTYRNASHGKRFLILVLPLFIAVFVLNVVWPYGV